MLSQPRIYLGGQCFQAQVMHHLRFSIEYLRRQSLLSPKGTPINFAGLVSHLYHTEDSAFAFHALLKSGFFHEVSKDILVDPDKVNHTLMITLANIFGRRPFKHSTEELKNKVNRSPSVIFLPRLPKQAADILAAHDKETQEVFESYVQTYVDQHLESPDDSLPLSAMVMGRTETSERTGFEPSVLSEVDEIIPSLSAVKVRSPFAALSGYGDEFSSVHDLCSSVRSGVFLEESVIPKLGRDDTLLNAYLFDFWNHQDLRAIDEDNDVRRAEIWFLLNGTIHPIVPELAF